MNEKKPEKEPEKEPDRPEFDLADIGKAFWMLVNTVGGEISLSAEILASMPDVIFLESAKNLQIEEILKIGMPMVIEYKDGLLNFKIPGKKKKKIIQFSKKIIETGG